MQVMVGSAPWMVAPMQVMVGPAPWMAVPARVMGDSVQ